LDEQQDVRSLFVLKRTTLNLLADDALSLLQAQLEAAHEALVELEDEEIPKRDGAKLEEGELVVVNSNPVPLEEILARQLQPQHPDLLPEAKLVLHH